MLPMLLGLLGGGLGTAGTLGSIGALGGAALGSGLGSFAQTGDLGEGIKTGIGAYLGGAALGALAGGAAGAGTKAAADAATGAAAGGAGAAAAPGMTFGTGLQSAVMPPASLNPSLLSQSTNFMKLLRVLGQRLAALLHRQCPLVIATPIKSLAQFSGTLPAQQTCPELITSPDDLVSSIMASPHHPEAPKALSLRSMQVADYYLGTPPHQ
jgi:hypothetical protein